MSGYGTVFVILKAGFKFCQGGQTGLVFMNHNNLSPTSVFIHGYYCVDLNQTLGFSPALPVFLYKNQLLTFSILDFAEGILS